MTIQEIAEKCKSFLDSRDLFTATLIILVGLGSFGLGRLSAQEASRSPLRIEYPGDHAEESASSVKSPVLASPALPLGEGKYVASKTGTRYYLPTCDGAKRIKEENKVWFKTKEDAERAGLTPAANCKGL